MGVREDIEELDSKVARLKVEYEQYFMRIAKREPARLRDEVEKIIFTYSNKNFTNTSYKFKFNSIVAKYNAYKQYWTRSIRAIEEGTYFRKAEGGEAGAALEETRPARPPKATGPVAPKSTKTGGGAGEITEIYNSYIDARKKCNEPVQGITPESLTKTIEQYKKKVEEQYKTTDVELKVYIKDGKAKLAITPKKG